MRLAARQHAANVLRVLAQDLEKPGGAFTGCSLVLSQDEKEIRFTVTRDWGKGLAAGQRTLVVASLDAALTTDEARAAVAEASRECLEATWGIG